jgi:3-hydroxyacyl-CoA dehydrogenase
VAVLGIANPPINALVPVIRSRLMKRLVEAAADPEVRAVVIIGNDGTFASGINHGELDSGIEEPDLASLCACVEDMEVPVVALIEGHAAGAGFELALAAHYRVAVPNARFGLPDLAIGLPPWGGASQRLPRLVGAASALHIMLGAHAHPVTSDLVAPLIDHVVEGDDPQQVAILFAKGLIQEGLGPRRSRDRSDGFRDAAGYAQAIERHRADVMEKGSAVERSVLQMVEAAQLLPFDAGVEMERAAFDDLVGTPRARALRHVMRAERRCGRLVGAVEPEVRSLGLIYANPQNMRLAAAALLVGNQVRLFDPTQGAAEKAAESIFTRLTATAERRGHSEKSVAAMRRNLSVVSALPDLAGVQLVVENGPDDPRIRRNVLNALFEALGKSAPILCMTDHMDCADLAPDPLRDRVMGLYLSEMDFPARLAEISAGAAVSDQALLIAQAGLKRLDRRLVRSRPMGGMIAPVMFDTYVAAADALIRAGVAPEAIEAAMTEGGFARGPYGMLANVSGQAYLARAARMAEASGTGLSHRLIQTGQGASLRRLGEVEGLKSLAAGLVDADMAKTFSFKTARDIQAAICAALVNRGVALIEAGAARRPMQIDVAMVQGFGYPRDHGGPMCHADVTGLFQVVRRCQALTPLDRQLWEPRAKFLDLQRNGQSFTAVNE